MYEAVDKVRMIQWDGSNEARSAIEGALGPCLRSVDGKTLYVRNRCHAQKDALKQGEYIILSPFYILHHILTEVEMKLHIKKRDVILCTGN